MTPNTSHPAPNTAAPGAKDQTSSRERIDILQRLRIAPSPVGTDSIGYENHLELLYAWNVPITGGDFVDIGSFLGGGTYKLASFLKAVGSSHRVISIDVFDITRDHTANAGGVRLQDIYRSQLTSHFGTLSQREVYDRVVAGLDNVVTLAEDSASLELPSQAIAFAFIDGSLVPSHVRSDFELVWNRTIPGGVVAIHNYNHDLPGVTEAVNRLLADFADSIGKSAVNDRIKTVYLQKRPMGEASPAGTCQPTSVALQKRSLFVLCPSTSVTGGPDALHQLVHVARTLGFDASLVYYPPTKEIPERYRVYDIKLSETIPNDPSSIVVVPEVNPEFLLGTYPKAVKVFWWLSWDWGAKHFPVVNRPDVLHACQSAYAMDMVLRRGIPADNACMLSDITRNEYLSPLPEAGRVDRVIFNPVKGREFTSLIMEANPDLEFIPVQNMKPAEVRTLLHTSKVYIDFGNHPGKDRVPREAAISGCCVLTANDKGASAYRQDIPIPRRYKFSTGAFDPAFIGERIRACFRDYHTIQSDFELYRANIRAEKWLFEEEIASMLERLNCRRSEDDPQR